MHTNPLTGVKQRAFTHRCRGKRLRCAAHCGNDRDVVRARGVWRNELEEEEGGAIADSGLQQVPATPALPCPALQHELGWHQRRYAHDNAVHLAARTYVTPPPSSTSEHSACLPLMHSVQSAK